MSGRVLLAAPRSFCAGVDRAIEIVERLLEQHGAPVYVRHQIVHNEHVVRRLEGLGAVFVEHEEEIPPGDGCDASLEWWFSAEAKRKGAESDEGSVQPVPKLPTECDRILAGTL